MSDSEEVDDSEVSESEENEDSDEDQSGSEDEEDSEEEGDSDENEDEEEEKPKVLGMSALYEIALEEEGDIIYTENKVTQTDPIPDLAPQSDTTPAEYDLQPTTLHDIQSISENLSHLLNDIKRTFEVENIHIEPKRILQTEPYSYPKYATPKRMQPVNATQSGDVIWGSTRDEPTLASKYAHHQSLQKKRRPETDAFSEHDLLKHSANILLKPSSQSRPKPPRRFERLDYSPPPKSKTLELYKKKRIKSASKAETYMNNHLKKTLTRNPTYNPDDRPASFM